MRVESVERLRATIGGYFWMPCPNCGRMFGGHEKDGELLWDKNDPTRGNMTCPHPECKQQVRAINKANGLPIFDETGIERYSIFGSGENDNGDSRTD